MSISMTSDVLKYLVTIEHQLLTAQLQPNVMDEFNSIEEFDDHYAINYRLKRFFELMTDLDDGSTHVGGFAPDNEDYIETCKEISDFTKKHLERDWGYKCQSDKVIPPKVLFDLWNEVRDDELYELTDQCEQWFGKEGWFDYAKGYAHAEEGESFISMWALDNCLLLGKHAELIINKTHYSDFDKVVEHIVERYKILWMDGDVEDNDEVFTTIDHIVGRHVEDLPMFGSIRWREETDDSPVFQQRVADKKAFDEASRAVLRATAQGEHSVDLKDIMGHLIMTFLGVGKE